MVDGSPTTVLRCNNDVSRVSAECPPLLSGYQHYTRGVDRADQMIGNRGTCNCPLCRSLKPRSACPDQPLNRLKLSSSSVWTEAGPGLQPT